MIPRLRLDEDTLENDVRYGIADCRRRVRSQRSTLRAQHPPPTDVSNGNGEVSAGSMKSYAEILATISMSQSSMSRLIECLLESNDSTKAAQQHAEREEAAVT